MPAVCVSIDWLVICLRAHPSIRSQGEHFSNIYWCVGWRLRRHRWMAPSWKLQRWKSPSGVCFIVWSQKPSHSMTLNKFNIASWFIINRLLLFCVKLFYGSDVFDEVSASRGEKESMLVSLRGGKMVSNEIETPALLRSAGRGYQSQKNRFVSP